MIILDFETNSPNEHDVIEVAAAKIELKDDEYVIKDMFHRYYLSRYPVNRYSYEVPLNKNPKLNETCKFYQIDFDEDCYHSATYDVSKTYEILKAMKKRS